MFYAIFLQFALWLYVQYFRDLFKNYDIFLIICRLLCEAQNMLTEKYRIFYSKKSLPLYLKNVVVFYLKIECRAFSDMNVPVTLRL